MQAIKRRAFQMARVLNELGADWHNLVNADGQTAYQMLEIEAEESRGRTVSGDEDLPVIG